MLLMKPQDLEGSRHNNLKQTMAQPCINELQKEAANHRGAHKQYKGEIWDIPCRSPLYSLQIQGLQTSTFLLFFLQTISVCCIMTITVLVFFYPELYIGGKKGTTLFLV
jgi:hypothetical protein